jgi:DNA (cytosine-5)-methyltransferase 1
MDMVPAGGSWINLPVEIQREFMGKSFYSSGGRRGMARRMSWDEPSLTLTTSPSQKQTERCHPEETRPFTVREYARIQTFPDDWNFSGSVSSQYKQIGNAVPVKLAEEVGKQIVKALKEEGTFSVKRQMQTTLGVSLNLQKQELLFH